MSSWSQHRKLLYGGSVTVVLFAIAAVIALKFIYSSPTCSDGVRNGREQGIDCGGSCVRLCQSEFLSPIVDWARFEEVAPGLYNIAAYIENPNPEGEAVDVPYKIELYDNRGVLITEFYGKTTLPPHRNTLAFQGAVNVRQRVPIKALFDFIAAPEWQKQADRLKTLAVTEKNYEEYSGGASSLSVTLKNTGIVSLGRMSVYAVLYDKDGNTLGFSKTIVDGIDAGAVAVAPFTWPRDHNGKVVSIEVLPVAE